MEAMISQNPLQNPLISPGRIPGNFGETIDFSQLSSIPGFHVVQNLLSSWGLDTSHLVTISVIVTVITSCFGFVIHSLNGLRASASTLWSFCRENLVSSARVHSSDIAFSQMMKWMNDNGVNTDSRNFYVTSRMNPHSAAAKRRSIFRNPMNPTEEEEIETEADAFGPKLKYEPAPGVLFFTYKGRLVIANRKVDSDCWSGLVPDETLHLTTIGRSPQLLRELLAEARINYHRSEIRKTTVYTVSKMHGSTAWDSGRSRPTRDIRTVIMDPQSKELIKRDAKEYLHRDTLKWYVERGVPYRRGYLLYGPPGTGKTSLSLALAGYLGLNLYILSLSSTRMNDESLTSLFMSLPMRCIVLLEDIDCAGVDRKRTRRSRRESDTEDSDSDGSNSDDEDGEKGKKNGKKRGRTGSSEEDTAEGKAPPLPPMSNSNTSRRSSGGGDLSFSGLLNVLDGVASQEGRILIMTTNHKETLDEALIRPGRVDLEIGFSYANQSIAAQVFESLYSPLRPLTAQEADEEDTPIDPLTIPKEGKKAHDSTSRISNLAKQFAEKIPEGEFSPAQLQGFVMLHKTNPEGAVQGIEQWVDNMRKKKAESTSARKRRNGGRRARKSSN